LSWSASVANVTRLTGCPSLLGRIRVVLGPNATLALGEALGELLQQRLRILQIFRLKALGEPVVNRG
jgi:hypothetical protein